MKHWKYLKYVIRHKWYVFQFCRDLDVSLWQAVIHDWSKFMPCEWFPYVEKFYGGEPVISYEPGSRPNHEQNVSDAKALRDRNFNRAWLHHQHHNPHHWQHWVLREDSGNVLALKMPSKYVREMVADWAGAGKAITGKYDLPDWYGKNKSKMVLAENTRLLVEVLIGDLTANEATQ